MFIGAFLLVAVGWPVFNELSPSRLWLVPVYYLTFAPGHAMFVVMSQTIVADYFGTRRFATIRGLAQSTAMPLGLSMPVFAGWIFDRNGSLRGGVLDLRRAGRGGGAAARADPPSAVVRAGLGGCEGGTGGWNGVSTAGSHSVL